MSEKKVVQVIEPAIKVVNFFGLAPYFRFQRPTEKAGVPFKVYAGTLWMAMIILCVYCELIKYELIYVKFNVAIIITNFLHYGSHLILNVFTTVYWIFIKMDKFHELLIQLLKFEDYVTLRKTFDSRHFTALLTLTIFITHTPIVLDGIIWAQISKWKLYEYYIPGEFNSACFNATLYYIFCVSRLITVRIIRLNQLMKRVAKDGRRREVEHILLIDLNIKSHEYLNNNQYELLELKQFGKLFSMLYDIIDLFNNLFGGIILCISLVTIIALLKFLVLIIVLAIDNQDIVVQLQYAVPKLSILSLTWTASYLVRNELVKGFFHLYFSCSYENIT